MLPGGVCSAFEAVSLAQWTRAVAVGCSASLRWLLQETLGGGSTGGGKSRVWFAGEGREFCCLAVGGEVAPAGLAVG